MPTGDALITKTGSRSSNTISLQIALCAGFLGLRRGPQYGDAGLQPEELVKTNVDQDGGGEERRFSAHPAHAADTALQAICQIGIHHNTGSKTHIESGNSHAKKAVDARFVGSSKAV